MKPSALVLAVAVVACKDKAPTRAARDCFAYKVPAGWHEEPSKTGADLVVMNAERFPLGDREMRDNFTVRFIPGVELAALKEQLLKSLATPGAADQATKEITKSRSDLPEIHARVIPKPAVTDITFAGHPAFQLRVDNTLDVGGAATPMRNTTTFVQFDDDIVEIATGYVASREATAKAAGEAFLASISFDRCH